MTPEQELKLDNLITELALEISQIQEDRRQRELVNARLERIERALVIPLVYSAAQAARRLGRSTRWLYDHLAELPKPIETDPLRFRVQEIDAAALKIAPRAPRRGRAGPAGGVDPAA